MTPEEIAERLKDIAYDLHLCALRATVRTTPDSWQTIEVCEAWLYSDARDGWDVTITSGSL